MGLVPSSLEGSRLRAFASLFQQRRCDDDDDGDDDGDGSGDDDADDDDEEDDL